MPALSADTAKVSLLSFCSSNKNKASKNFHQKINLKTEQSKLSSAVLVTAFYKKYLVTHFQY